MQFGLRRNEIIAFSQLCRQETPVTIGVLGQSLGWSKSVASRTANGLASKGLADLQRNGRTKFLTLSKSAHALALKELMASNEHVALQDLLAGSTMRVLSGLLYPPASVNDMARRTQTPQITVRWVLSRLLERGLVVRHKAGAYSMALPGLREFVEAYCFFAVDQRRSGVSGSLIVRGGTGLLRTSSQRVPEFMVLTGVSVFGDFGVGLVETDSRDYFYGAWGKPVNPNLEEAVVHALVRSTLRASEREVAYALLVLYKNRTKVNDARFLELAGDFGVSGKAQQGLEFVDCVLSGRPVPRPLFDLGTRVEGPLFPDEGEFKELVKQYG